MQLDKLQASLRERTPFEAIDLGVAMFRRWAGPINLGWFIATLPWYIITWVALSSEPFVALLILWWLKPIFDRVPLFIVSRALFGDTPTRRETLRQLPKLWRGNLFHALLLYRLDPARSFFLPVLLLEGGERKLRARRRAALMRTMGGPATWLTLTCIGLELVVFAGLIGLVLIMLPDTPNNQLSPLWEHFKSGDSPLWLKATIPLASFLATALIEPIYVSAGFALYLNRRTRLEGWDIELIFRRIAKRLVTTGSGGRSLLVLALTATILGALSLTAPNRAAAQTVPLDQQQAAPHPDGVAPPPGNQQPSIIAPPLNPLGTNVSPPPPILSPPDPNAPIPEEVIDDILARPDFEHRAKRTLWRSRSEPSNNDFETPSFLEGLTELFAAAIEILLWVVAGVLLAATVLLIIRRLRALEAPSKRAKGKPLPSPSKGKNIPHNEAPLPHDIPRAAMRLFEAGEPDRALGLLYRGALTGLVEIGDFEISPDATEAECLEAVRRATPENTSKFFTELTRGWQQVAYAHRTMEPTHFQYLCQGWSSHFAEAP